MSLKWSITSRTLFSVILSAWYLISLESKNLSSCGLEKTWNQVCTPNSQKWLSHHPEFPWRMTKVQAPLPFVRKLVSKWACHVHQNRGIRRRLRRQLFQLCAWHLMWHSCGRRYSFPSSISVCFCLFLSYLIWSLRCERHDKTLMINRACGCWHGGCATENQKDETKKTNIRRGRAIHLELRSHCVVWEF